MGRFIQQTHADAQTLRAEIIQTQCLPPRGSWPLGEATHLQKFVASDCVGKGWVCGGPEGEEAPFLLRN